MTVEELLALAARTGFDHTAALNMSALKPLPEVRDMCRADKCRSFGKSWSCPPACGTLDESGARLLSYGRGILVQTTGRMEDDFDIDTIGQTERRHKDNFKNLVGLVRQEHPLCLPLGAGACTRCDVCTYPHDPCRFPETLWPSMEAFGLLVSQVCADSGLPYYYGPRTITFTSCILPD